MNEKQIKVLWVGVILITLMAIFPPWLGRKRNESEKFIGFHFVFIQPKYRQLNHPSSYRIINGQRVNDKSYYSRYEYQNSRIDLGRFVMQIIPVVLICGGLICTYRDKENKSRTNTIVNGSNDIKK